MDKLGLRTIDAVSFEDTLALEQHTYLNKPNRISDRNRLPVISSRLTKCIRPVMKNLTISWTTVQQHNITAILIIVILTTPLISDLRSAQERAARPSAYPRARRKLQWLIQRNRGSFADGPNVVGEQLSLQVQIYALKNVGMVSDSTLILDRRSLGRNTILVLSYKRATHSVGDMGI